MPRPSRKRDAGSGTSAVFSMSVLLEVPVVPFQLPPIVNPKKLNGVFVGIPRKASNELSFASGPVPENEKKAPAVVNVKLVKVPLSKSVLPIEAPGTPPVMEIVLVNVLKLKEAALPPVHKEQLIAPDRSYTPLFRGAPDTVRVSSRILEPE
jgi:hypothetical protein